MPIIPRFKVELIRKDENGEVVQKQLETPIDITDAISTDTVAGIETTKDTFTFRVPNNLVDTSGTGSKDWNSRMGLGGTDPIGQTANRFKINDDIKIYAWNDVQPTNLNDALLIAGPITEFSYSTDESSATISILGTNRTEDLLRGFLPSTTLSNDPTVTTAPEIIRFLINDRLATFGPKAVEFNLKAFLDNETNPFTGSPGTVITTPKNIGSFLDINYSRNFQPLMKTIQELSQEENTGDNNAGPYMFFIKSTPALSSKFAELGANFVNELVWTFRTDGVDDTLTRDADYSSITTEKRVFDVKNFIIYKAGFDLLGRAFTGTVGNWESIGQVGFKADYLPLTDIRDNILTLEQSLGEGLGSSFGNDGFPAIFDSGGSWDFNSFNTTSVASTDETYNAVLRTEIERRAKDIAQQIVDRLGQPRFEITAEMYTGRNDFIPGQLIKIEDKTFGWEGPIGLANPRILLRLTDIRHAINQGGWTTSLVLKDDGEVLKRFEDLGVDENGSIIFG